MGGRQRFNSRCVAQATFLLAVVLCATSGASEPASASTQLDGTGPMTPAAFELNQWDADVSQDPWDLNVIYTSTNSWQARYEFAEQAEDFGVSDIPYQPSDPATPSFPFVYLPVVAQGVAFEYHINGLSTTLQLSSYSICSIFTGAVSYWDDPIIEADNPGVSLPHLPIVPVITTDLSGVNYVVQDYCIEEQTSLWASFVSSPAVTGYPGQVSDLSASEPHPDWPLFTGAMPVASTSAAASDVTNSEDNGYIAFVETQYASGSPVASVENASGDYTQPTAVDVTSALTYDSQGSNGTPAFDFGGLGPNVYNPSTYEFLMVPTTGWDPSKGAVMSQYVNYVLTYGQQELGPSDDPWPSMGLPLEQYDINAVQAEVPGAVAMTASEQTLYDCGDLTQSEVQVGETTPSCTGPPSETPEAPFALGLPLAAGVTIGVYCESRRRHRRRAAAI